MPFTPTHILAVVSIAAVGARWLPFAALASGAMVPDLPLFVLGVVDYGQTHSVAGLVTADLPLGMAGYLIFMGLLRRPLVALLPDAWQRRCTALLRRKMARSWGAWLRVAVAVVLGAATHLIWDSFTHQGRWGVAMIPWLGEPVLIWQGQGIPGYNRP